MTRRICCSPFYFMKQVQRRLVVVKPDLCKECMCVYKFTLDNGFYYYGATSDLQERIMAHLKNYRGNKMPKSFVAPFETAKKIVFEVVRFANNRKRLKAMEDYFLENNVGLPMCLNEQKFSASAYKRGDRVLMVAKLNSTGEILKIYKRFDEVSFDLNITTKRVKSLLRAKYKTKEGYFLRNLSDDGSIINPDFSCVDFNKGRKPVSQYDVNMNLIASFSSIADASRATLCNDKSIRGCANGKQKLAKGFVFRFS